MKLRALELFRVAWPRVILLPVVACTLWRCGDDQTESLGLDDELSTVAEALCSPGWVPTWQQETSANEWWVEYRINGGRVTSGLETVTVGEGLERMRCAN